LYNSKSNLAFENLSNSIIFQTISEDKKEPNFNIYSQEIAPKLIKSISQVVESKKIIYFR
jgi:hypothetical protein